MLVLLMWRMPTTPAAPGTTFSGASTLLRQPAVARPLLLTLLYFTAIFTLFAYIGPVLQALGPMSVQAVSLILLVVGVAGVLGTLLGGWATDRMGARTTLLWQLSVLTLSQTALPLMASQSAGIVLVLFIWGVAGFGMMPPQQSRLAAAAPTSAPLLLSLNTSMLYLGTALGAIVGGLAGPVLGFGKLAWAGLPFLFLGLLLLVRRD
jgi:MFS transporter, DHA1 family, inner membrane transport protein